jgi:ankyrin repeat protein
VRAGRTALHRALGGGFEECVRLLIDKGADLNKPDNLKRTALHWASMAPPPGNVECVKIIFEKGDAASMLTTQSRTGWTPLHAAVGTSRVDVVHLTLARPHLTVTLTLTLTLAVASAGPVHGRCNT